MKYLAIFDSEEVFVCKPYKQKGEELCVDGWITKPNWSPLNSESEAAARKIIEGMGPKPPKIMYFVEDKAACLAACWPSRDQGGIILNLSGFCIKCGCEWKPS